MDRSKKRSKSTPLDRSDRSDQEIQSEISWNFNSTGMIFGNAYQFMARPPGQTSGQGLVVKVEKLPFGASMCRKVLPNSHPTAGVATPAVTGCERERPKVLRICPPQFLSSRSQALSTLRH